MRLWSKKLNDTSNSLVLGLLVWSRDIHLLHRALLLAERAYRDSLQVIIIVRKEPVELDLKGLSSRIIVIDYLDNSVPQFFNMQKVYLSFIRETSATHLITIDPDTIVLDWDHTYHELAGQFIFYKKARIQERLQTMPPKVRHHFRSIQQTGCVHSIQGGWSMRSRQICERMAAQFFLDDTGEWKPEQWKGHELFFGLYLKMAGIRHLRDRQAVRRFVDKQARYFTEGERHRIRKKLKKAHAFHPVKTQEDFDWLMDSLIPNHREQILQWLQEKS